MWNLTSLEQFERMEFTWTETGGISERLIRSNINLNWNSFIQQTIRIYISIHILQHAL